MKKKKYNNGGILEQLLPSALSLIPGGNFVSPFLQNMMQDNQPQAYTPKPIMSTNPFGRMLGGPIVPMAQESTYVPPRPFLPQLPIVPPTNYQSTDQFQNQQMRANNTYNPFTGLGKYDALGGTGKVHSKDRFREKFNGGNIVNDDFKQYNSGSHKSGNDTEIDQFGNPVSNGVAAIQNKENMYKGFILSDTLTNLETGNKFNVDAMKINKKYPNARLSDIDKNSLDFEMNKLQVLNQEKIDKVENKKAKGGYIRPPQIPYGDPNDAYNRSNELLQLPNTPVIPDGNPVDAYNQAGSLISPLYTNLNPLPTPLQSRGNTNLTLPTFNNTTGTTNQIPANSTVSNTSERSGLSALDAIGLGLKGAALIRSGIDAASNSQVDPLILPDYQAADNYMKSANIDYSQAEQSALGVSNMASNNIRSMSGNAGQYMSRQSGRLAQLQDTLSNINQQEANAQSQLNLNKGQYEANKAMTNRNIKYENQQNNFMNDANQRGFQRDFFSNLSQIGTEFNQASNLNKAIQNQADLSKFNNSQIIMFLNNKYPNVKVDQNIIDRIRKGESIDNIINVTI